MEEKTYEIRSEEVQDILSYVPNWMVRWGISLISIIIIMILVLSWVIKYPDSIEGKVILTTQNPPIKLVNRIDGKLMRLLVKDGEKIKAGTVIAEIENAISSTEVEYLKKTIEEIDKQLSNGKEFNNPSGTFSFGEVQEDYNRMIQNLKDYQAHISNSYAVSRRKTLTEKIESHKSLMEITSRQISLIEKETNNVKDKYETHKLLFDKGIISKFDFLEKENEYHQQLKQIESANSTLINLKITISDLKDDLAKEQFAFDEKKRELVAGIEESIKNIKNYLELWYQNNTLIAPIDGKLAYLKPLAENQYLTSSEAIFSIVPSNNEFQGNLEITSLGIGKVRTDQKVIIKFDNYPYREFGQVIAKVDHISDLPFEDKYMIRVGFPEGLSTSFNRNLSYQPEMTGSAEVITNDLRLFQRLINSVTGIIE